MRGPLLCSQTIQFLREWTSSRRWCWIEPTQAESAVPLNIGPVRAATIVSTHYILDFHVGQVGNLRPIGNRPSNYSARAKADCQSAAGCHPAPHDQDQFWFLSAPRRFLVGQTIVFRRLSSFRRQTTKNDGPPHQESRTDQLRRSRAVLQHHQPAANRQRNGFGPAGSAQLCEN
jgi:hypothetical protein